MRISKQVGLACTALFKFHSVFDAYTAGDIHSQIKIRPRNHRLKYSYYLVWFGFDFSVPGATPTAVKYFKREELDSSRENTGC